MASIELSTSDLDLLALFEVPDFEAWNTPDVQVYLTERHHLGDASLVLYWLRQEVLHIKKKALLIQLKGSECGFWIRPDDCKLVKLIAQEDDHLSGLRYYVDEYAIYRFEEGISPLPKGLTFATQSEKRKVEAEKRRAELRKIDLSRLSQHKLNKMLYGDRSFFHGIIEDYRRSGLLTAAEAAEATAENTREKHKERFEALTQDEKREFIHEHERKYDLGEKGEEAAEALRELSLEDPRDVELDQIREDEDGDDDNEGVEGEKGEEGEYEEGSEEGEEEGPYYSEEEEEDSLGFEMEHSDEEER